MHVCSESASRRSSTVLSYFAAALGYFAAALGSIGLLCAGLAPNRARAQSPTPVTSIVNSAQDTTLEVNYNGSLLLPGTRITDGTEADSIPATGEGTRLMWYPAKAAFRAGEVSSSNWDAANVGVHSVALGFNTTASGDGATAVGQFTTASGTNATAIGSQTTAATGQSLSIGTCNSANTSADGTLLVAGNGAFDVLDGSCSRSDAMVLKKDGGLVVGGNMGSGSIPATGAGTRMMWYPAKAAFRAGQVTEVSGKEDVWDADSVGTSSVAFGQDTKANGAAATAMGSATTASGPVATAMGQETTASGVGATAMGSSTTASGRGATAMGLGTTASGKEATAMGVATTAATDRSLSIGKHNSANTSADNTLFVVGNGSSSSRSDALVLEESGNLTISGTLTESSDRRLKTQVEPLGEGTLGKLLGLRPVRFQFRDQQTHPSGEQIGLIAQDVREEFPSLVSKSSGGYLSLAYPKMTAVLLKGIQEQQATIDSLETRVDRLERLQKRVAELESRSDASLLAGLPGSRLFLGLLLGGLVGAGLLWRQR